MCIISYFNFIAGKISIVLSSYKFVSIFFPNNEQNICLPLVEGVRLYLVVRGYKVSSSVISWLVQVYLMYLHFEKYNFLTIEIEYSFIHINCRLISLITT